MQDPLGFLHEAQKQEEQLSSDRQQTEQLLLALREQQAELEAKTKLVLARLLLAGALPPKAHEWSAQARDIAAMAADPAYAEDSKKLGLVKVRADHYERVLERLRNTAVALTTQLSYAKAVIQGGG
jgi:hypothetical protein